MKSGVRYLFLWACVCLCASCASTGYNSAGNRPRFHEAAAANVVIKFNSWECIFLTRPDYRENGFMHILNRETLGQAFAKSGVQHDLAVVCLGWNYDSAQLSETVNQWKTILSAQGFHRVVCVQTADLADIDNTAVVDDTRFSHGHPLLSQDNDRH